MRRHRPHEDPQMQDLILRACLDTAGAYARLGNLDEAEQLYDQALIQAETMDGEASPLVALVLLDMFDLYEKQGRYEEGKALWNRIREIAVIALKTHGLSKSQPCKAKGPLKMRFKRRF